MKPLFITNPDLKNKRIAIYGTDRQALLLFSVMLQNEIYVECFVSRQAHPANLKIMNKPVISLDVVEDRKNMILVVWGGADGEEQAAQLEKQGFTVFCDYNLASYEGDCVFI